MSHSRLGTNTGTRVESHTRLIEDWTYTHTQTCIHVDITEQTAFLMSVGRSEGKEREERERKNKRITRVSMLPTQYKSHSAQRDIQSFTKVVDPLFGAQSMRVAIDDFGQSL